MTGQQALARVEELGQEDRAYVLAWLVMNHPASVDKALTALELNALCKRHVNGSQGLAADRAEMRTSGEP
jgi:hypothetical protein